MTITIGRENLTIAQPINFGGTFQQRYAYETEVFLRAKNRKSWGIGTGDYREPPSLLNRYSPPTHDFLQVLLQGPSPMTCIDIGAGNATSLTALAELSPQHEFILHNLSANQHPSSQLPPNVRKFSSDYEGLETTFKRNKQIPVDIVHERCGPLSLSLVPELVLSKYTSILSKAGVMVLSNPWASSLLYPKDLIPNIHYVMDSRNDALITSLYNLHKTGWGIYSLEANGQTCKRLEDDNFEGNLTEKKAIVLMRQ